MNTIRKLRPIYPPAPAADVFSSLGRYMREHGGARAERAEIAQVEQAALSQSRYPVTIDDAIAEGREP